MTRQYEGGYGCRYCDYTGWTYEGTERASAGPDPTPDVTPEPCPHCSPPSGVPELDLDSDAARWMADSDQGEALPEGVAIGVG